MIRRPAGLFQSGQSGGVFSCIAAGRHYQIVTTVLALGADHPGYPPNRRMVEQESLYYRLQQIDQIVVPLYVRQFVQQNRFHLCGGHPRQHTDGRQNHGAQIADDHRHIAETCLEQRDRLRDSQPGAQMFEPPRPRIGRATDTPIPRTLRRHPARNTAQMKNDDTRNPEGRQARQYIVDTETRRRVGWRLGFNYRRVWNGMSDRRACAASL